jgi:hypothetical protein
MIGRVYRWARGDWRVLVRWRWSRRITRVCLGCGLINTPGCDCVAAHREIKGCPRNVLIERVVQPPHFREPWVPADPPELVVRPFRGLRRA